jgi:hypothetical protein
MSSASRSSSSSVSPRYSKSEERHSFSGDSDEDSSSQEESEEDEQTPVYLMTDFSALLEEATPGSVIVLDIDETIMVTRNSPSLLLATEGVQSFQVFVHQQVQEWKQKNQLCKDLQKALKDKVLVTAETAATIHQLQERGCAVFGLTARYFEYAAVTEAELTQLGVDLSRTSPFPPSLADPCSEAVVQNGIVYCNSMEKGPVLRGLVENFLFREKLAAKRGRADAAAPVAAAAPTATAAPLPGNFLYVDDLYANAASVCKHITPVVQHELGMEVSSYHYVPPALAELQAYPNPDLLKQLVVKKKSSSDDCKQEEARPASPDSAEIEKWRKILEKQMRHFIARGEVLTNEKARIALGMQAAT